jgi:Protein of unknown function (DUF998)
VSSPSDRSNAATSALLLGGAVAGPVFVAVFMIEGATSSGYDPMRLPVSLLSTGEDGWRQVLNFIVDGALLFGFAIGLYRAFGQRSTPATLGPLLMGVFALGIIGAGLFSTDPGAGYPPGVRPPVEPTTHSIVHDAVSLVVFIGLPIACFVLAREFAGWRDRVWATYSAVTGLVLTIGVVLLLIGFNGSGGLSDEAGLIQRVWIVVGWGWIALLAVHMLRSTEGAAGSANPRRAP